MRISKAKNKFTTMRISNILAGTGRIITNAAIAVTVNGTARHFPFFVRLSVVML
jgi:hypothetical protein